MSNFYRLTKSLWSKAEFEKIFESFDFNSIMNDDEALLRWLEALSVSGIALLKNTPPTNDEVNKIANRVSFVRKTHFGDNFEVKVKRDTSTFAYTSAALQLHTDIPYYRR